MAQAKAAGAKRAKRVVEAEGIAHITATFNNTLITITDMQGNAITWGSSGKAGFQGSKKSTPFAATVAAEQAAREALNLGVRRVHVRVQGPGSGRESAIQALATAGLQIRSIRDQLGCGVLDLIFQPVGGDKVRRAIELFGTQVLPRIRDL